MIRRCLGRAASDCDGGHNVGVCAFTGLDDALNAPIYVRNVFGAEDLRIGHQFGDIIAPGANGEISIDDAKFHDSFKEAAVSVADD